ISVDVRAWRAAQWTLPRRVNLRRGPNELHDSIESRRVVCGRVHPHARHVQIQRVEHSPVEDAPLHLLNDVAGAMLREPVWPMSAHPLDEPTTLDLLALDEATPGLRERGVAVDVDRPRHLDERAEIGLTEAPAEGEFSHEAHARAQQERDGS